MTNRNTFMLDIFLRIRYKFYVFLINFCIVYTIFVHLKFVLQQQIENGAFNWSMMPLELRPNWKRKLNIRNGPRKMAKDVNVEETLKVLEKKEENKKIGGTKRDNDDKESDVCSKLTNVERYLFFIFDETLKIAMKIEYFQEDLEDEEQDEEMDEDNDYGNNYFDDGGNYLDEDDNLDDGPTY